MESTLVPNYNTISTSPKPLIVKIRGDEEEETTQSRRPCFRWKPTSMREFEAAEKQLMSYITLPVETRIISAGEILEPSSLCRAPKLRPIEISTAIVSPPTAPQNEALPFVFIHGLLVGKCTFCFLVNEVSKERTVYAIDLPGFGRSTRVKFPKDAAAAEETYITIIEAWRKSIGLEKFILVGYSLGGFLATSYALKYPERVEQLALLDPYGYAEKPETVTNIVGETNPIVIRIMASFCKRVNFIAPVRMVGPLGPWLNVKMSNGFFLDFAKLGEGMSEGIEEYTYHCVAKKPSGETAFRNMTRWVVYAKNPLQRRLHLLNSNIPVTIFYPETSYIPKIPEDQLRTLLSPDGRLTIHRIPNTHHDNIFLSKELATLLCSISVTKL